jgi:predicted Zn-dependent protease
VREYQGRRQAHPGEPQIPEAAMNQAGYALLRGGKVKDAIALFRQNVEDHPESWNVHDSLAEALAADGDKEGAIRSYERSLELNAANTAAKEAIKKLRAQRP